MLKAFRPRFWELVGVLVGVAGLIAGGTIVVELNPSTTQVIALFTIAALMVFGGYSARALWFNRSFPFFNVEHDVVLRFSIEQGTDGQKTLAAKLARTTRFSARFKSLRYFDRFQLVPDSPNDAADAVLKSMGHGFRVRVLEGGSRKEWIPIGNVTCRPDFKTDRELTLLYDFQQDMKSRGKRFEIFEELNLPNDFGNAEEWYTFRVSEPSKRRKFTFEFDGITVNSARYYIKHGTNEGPVNPIRLVKPPAGINRPTSFSQEVKSATVGSLIVFRWDWELDI